MTTAQPTTAQPTAPTAPPAVTTTPAAVSTPAATTVNPTAASRTASTSPAAPATTPPPADAPYRFFDLRVLRTERLSPSMLRVTLGGTGPAAMGSAGRDQRIKLFFPHPGQDAPVVPRDDDGNWYAAWCALDPHVRGIMRTYTTRDLRRDPDELVVDFALHPGAEGPASRWATAAAPGDRLCVLAPSGAENAGYDFRPPPGTTSYVLAGDESALPALAGILASLPPGAPARVWIEVQDPADRQHLPTAADAEVTWLVRDPASPLLDAVRAAALPDPASRPYAWIAGESATVRALRRHLVQDRGYDRKAIRFSGYWRPGTSEDQLLTSNEAA
ncbi:siderophore-interacting protein [Streptomyces sp. NPDC058657]|uniref:siderophore-interacting protein n=1 Tax=unclassified Streptomyces TaxID=2593676 RepID=UPI003655D353